MLGELRAADAGAVAALIVGANPRPGIDADDAAAERHRSVFRRRTVGAFVLLALAPAAVAIPALAALALVSAVCSLVVAYEAIRHRSARSGPGTLSLRLDRKGRYQRRLSRSAAPRRTPRR